MNILKFSAIDLRRKESSHFEIREFIKVEQNREIGNKDMMSIR